MVSENYSIWNCFETNSKHTNAKIRRKRENAPEFATILNVVYLISFLFQYDETIHAKNIQLFPILNFQELFTRDTARNNTKSKLSQLQRSQFNEFSRYPFPCLLCKVSVSR